MARASIDRFEGDLAVLISEDGERRCPRSRLPPGAREGDVIDLESGRIDAEETARLREEVSRAREAARARQGAPPDDFEL